MPESPDAMPGASGPPSRALWVANAALAEACLRSPFVRGLADGTLAADAFRRYVAQDAFFLRAFFSAYALAAARAAAPPSRAADLRLDAAPELDAARRLHALMAGVLEELELHRAYAARLDIDLDRVTPNDAARGYTDFLSRTAWTSELGEIMAAMTPCMRLYAWLGRRLHAEGALDGNPYRDWIETYASDDFEGLAAELEALLDELAVGTPAETAAYAEAMRRELDFFEAFA